ncbi:MAG: hypothetical protein NC453_29285 [Muribaculum sp.]|nr:hypothetical protein [Muribaculum sp.]
MKLNIQHLIFPVLASCVLAGCGSPRKAITATPSPCVVTPDSAGKVNLDVAFNVPGHYLSKRSRLFITPSLFVGDTLVEEYEPLVLDASIYRKKTERKEVLHGYVDPYADVVRKAENTGKSQTYPYAHSIEIPEDIESGRIMAVISSDGCGQCTGIDTIDVASISIPVTLIDPKESLHNVWIEPEFVVRPKVHNGKGEARLQFIVDKWNIVMDLANNRRELTGMVETLRPILSDTLATLTSLNIFGSASAEASYQHNIMLANNRANSAKNWLSKELSLPQSVRDIIKVGAAPEGWEPVVQAMIAANDPDSTLVRELMVKYPGPTDDAAEKYIRRLKCWPRIRDNYLAKDRKVLYDYSWTIKSFTDDAELIDMYRKRPDAFNEDELLRVASLAKNDTSRIEVYKTLMNYFPQSSVAANNLAVLYLNNGDNESARRVLEEAEEFTPEMIATLAASYIYADDYEKAVEILQKVELPEARYNLGLLKAKQRKLGEAYELLRPFEDTNSAILALSVNRNDEAQKIMDNLKNASPVAEYVRALIAARNGDSKGVATHLGNACADEKLRQRALVDVEFSNYANDPDFRNAVNK